MDRFAVIFKYLLIGGNGFQKNEAANAELWY